MTRFGQLMKHLRSTTFFSDPASAIYHCNYVSGLHVHSTNVFANLIYLSNRLKLRWQKKDSMVIIAMAHDMCKIGSYLIDGDGKYIKNPNHPKGHGDLSVKMVKEIIDITEEEEACIRWHMGAFDEKENWNLYNAAVQKFPNVLWTHTADMMATHFDEVKKDGE